MEELKINHTYLIKLCNSSSLVSSITVLKITKMAYFIRWNKGLNSNDEWVEKEYISKNYYVVEDITEYTDVIDVEKLKKEYEYIKNPPTTKTEWIQCHVCKGFGTIPEIGTTAGNKPCPLCNGSRVIPKITQIT